MTKFFDLATHILEDVDFPVLPPEGAPREYHNFRYPLHGPEFFAHWNARPVHPDGVGLTTLHLHWLRATRSNIAVEAIGELMSQVTDGGVPIHAVTGRVTTGKVLDLVEAALDDKGWHTFVRLGDYIMGLDCISNGPQSGELLEQLTNNVESGSPFVSFRPELNIV